EPEVEVRRIDPDEDIGSLVQDLPQQVAADSRKLAITLQRIDVAMHGEPFAWPARLEALGLHPGPADTEELRVGHMLPERTDQMAGKQVAGGFSGDHGNTDRHRKVGVLSARDHARIRR